MTQYKKIPVRQLFIYWDKGYGLISKENFLYVFIVLTHWGRGTDICVGDLTIIG